MDGHGDATERFDTVVIGGGQTGLTVGYHLARHDRRFVILDASERIGDAWRHRWDSLRLFTPARYDGLDGLPFPADPEHFPTKDEVADYLESYAERFALPVRSGVRVERLSRDGDGFLVETTDGTFEAPDVVVAMADYQVPHVPPFADELDPRIVQLHSAEYRNPSQLQPGPVLLVGAGNSGAEIAMEVSAEHPTILAGRDTGHVPFRIEGWFGRKLGVRFVIGFLFHHAAKVSTPLGRKMRSKLLTRGWPLVRTKPEDLEDARVERVGRLTEVRDGRPVLDDGRVLDVANVIWSTGYRPGFDWIDLPIHGDHGPRHELGIVPDEPGLYFVGLNFLSAASSDTIRGLGRDARRIVEHLIARDRTTPADAPATPVTSA